MICCAQCLGRGHLFERGRCPRCKGSGLGVRVGPGVIDGDRVAFTVTCDVPPGLGARMIAAKMTEADEGVAVSPEVPRGTALLMCPPSPDQLAGRAEYPRPGQVVAVRGLGETDETHQGPRARKERR